jgi:hypothetical protein
MLRRVHLVHLLFPLLLLQAACRVYRSIGCGVLCGLRDVVKFESGGVRNYLVAGRAAVRWLGWGTASEPLSPRHDYVAGTSLPFARSTDPASSTIGSLYVIAKLEDYCELVTPHVTFRYVVLRPLNCADTRDCRRVKLFQDTRHFTRGHMSQARRFQGPLAPPRG